MFVDEWLYGNNVPHLLFASYNVDHPTLNLLGIQNNKQIFYSQADRKGGGVSLGPDRMQS